jgi:uncharacterized protein (TIGR02611 family)
VAHDDEDRPERVDVVRVTEVVETAEVVEVTEVTEVVETVAVADEVDEPWRPEWLRRAREWSQRGRSRRLAWQTTVIAVGGLLVVAGLAMLVLPGPGWAAIILGLVVLASEYAWAHRVLRPVRRAADKAAKAAMDPAARRRNLVLLGFAVLIVAACVAWYVSAYGWTFDGLTWLPFV